MLQKTKTLVCFQLLRSHNCVCNMLFVLNNFANILKCWLFFVTSHKQGATVASARVHGKKETYCMDIAREMIALSHMACCFKLKMDLCAMIIIRFEVPVNAIIWERRNSSLQLSQLMLRFIHYDLEFAFSTSALAFELFLRKHCLPIQRLTMPSFA